MIEGTITIPAGRLALRRPKQDVAGALAGHAFDSLGLRRLEADVDPRNERSIRTMERLGFKREGPLRREWSATANAGEAGR